MERKMNLTDELQAALDNCERIETGLAKEAKLLADSAAEHNGLLKTIDISDPGQLQRMTTLLTISAVGGGRRTYRHKENEAAQVALVTACSKFVKEDLAPRCRQIESRVRVNVEKKLKPHFGDGDALRSAANHSTELTALAPILNAAVIQDYSADGAIKQAKRLLEAWSAADAFEAKFLD
jgi:hypothetical protein